jgi:hypothetical protein
MGFKQFTRKVKCRTPLQFNIGLFFVLYAVIVVGLLWILETMLLPKFYYVFKTRETQRIALSLLEDFKAQDAETFQQTLDYTAVSNQMCISMYDSKNRGMYFRDTMNNNCLIHGYNNQHFLLKFVEALDESPDGSICMTVYDEHIGTQTLVVGYVVGSKDDVGGCLFINTILEPVGATIRIQKTMILMFSAVLLVIGIREVNNYTGKQTLKVILLTLFTVLILALIVFILYILWAQVFKFFGEIFGEVVYRVG